MPYSPLSVLGPTSLTKFGLPPLPLVTSCFPLPLSWLLLAFLSVLLCSALLYCVSPLCVSHSDSSTKSLFVHQLPPRTTWRTLRKQQASWAAARTVNGCLCVRCPSSCLSDVSVFQKLLRNGHGFSTCFFHHVSGSSVS